MKLITALTFSAAALLAAPSKEIVQLQRDVAALDDQVRTLQRSLDEKMAALQTLMQQNLENANRANTTMAVLERGMSDRMGEQAKNLVAPIAAVNSKLDQMTTEFQSVRQDVTDMTSRIGKLEAQLVDLSNTLKVMNNPPAPPPAGATGAPGAGMAPATPPAGMSAKQVYDSAMRDRSGGNLDLAMQGFQEYLKYYGTTELAPNAQFYLGEISYNKGDLPGAIQAFDMVLERYPENNKTPDAMYMKGMALLKSGQRTQAGREFLNVVQKFPRSEVAAKARAQRQALGLSIPNTPATSGRRTRR